MNLNGNSAFSRTTVASWRGVSFFSLTAILANLLELDTSKVTVFNVSVSNEQFTVIATIFLSWLLVSHVVNWYGDFVSLRGWNIALKNETVEIFWGGRKPLSSKWKMLFTDIDNMNTTLEAGDFEGFESNLASVKEQLESVCKHTFHFSAYARFYAYFWYLGFPVFSTAIALVVMYYPHA